MKIVVIVARILLGLLFVFAGSNHIFNFMPPGQMPAGPAGQFTVVLMQTHYLLVVGVLQVVAGLMLLFNRFVPLALTILGPIIVNIALVSILMLPMGLPAAAVATVLWFVVFYSVRSAFAGVFRPRT